MISTFSESEYKSVGKNSGENVNGDKAKKDLALQPVSVVGINSS